MAKKRKSSKRRKPNYGNKPTVVQKSSRKPWIIVGAVALAVAIALTVVLALVLGSSDSDIDLAAAEVSLKKAGYTVGKYVPELSGYNGVVESLTATLTENSSGSLSDYVNTDKEVVNCVRFNNEENAKSAYEIFLGKWSEKYEEYGLIGNTVYFGTADACDIATATLEEI